MRFIYFWKSNRYRSFIATLVVFLGFGLTACQLPNSTKGSLSGVQQPVPDPKPNLDPTSFYTGPSEVANYVGKFIGDAAIQGVEVISNMDHPKLEIQISSLSSYGSSVIGLCESGPALRRVTFDPTFWNAVDDTQRELLTHHELGHCVLGRPHRSDLLPTGAYASIMYPIIMRDSTYTSNYAYYQSELYTQAEQSPSGAFGDPNRVQVHICGE